MAFAHFKLYLQRRKTATMAFFAFILLVALGVFYSLVVYQTLHTQAQAENLAADLAQAENGGHFIGDHQQSLLTRLSIIAGRNAFRHAVVQRDGAELRSFLEPLVGNGAQMVAGYVTDASGRAIESLPPGAKPGMPVPGLQPGRAAPHVSPVHPCPGADNRPVVTLSAPVPDPEGKPVGYLALCQRTDMWAALFQRLSARPGRSLYLFDQNGNVLFSNAQGADPAQTDLAAQQAELVRQSGRAMARLDPAARDETAFFVAAAPVPGLGWGVAVVQDYDAAMAPARLMFRNIIFFMGLLLVCLLFLSFLLMSRYRMQQRMLLELDEEARRLENLVQQRTADLRQTTERFRNLVQDLPDVVYELDASSRVTFVSRAVTQVLGFEPGEMLGKPWRDFVDPKDRAIFDEERRLAEGGEKISILALRHLTREGHARWLSIHSRALLDSGGNPTGRLGVARDVSSEVLAERKIRELSGMLINAQEEERKLIALDLHDEMGQILSALKIGLQSLGQREPGQREDITGLITLTQRVMDQIRALAYHLRPAILDNFGLVAAIEDLCESMAGSKLLSVEYKLDQIDEDNLSPQFRTSMFRFVQEALTNAVKHSGSLRVEVSLKAQKEQMFIQVRDWGKGFNVAQALDVGKHLGLAGMRERISLIGGQLIIDSSSKGSTLTVRAPLGGDHWPDTQT